MQWRQTETLVRQRGGGCLKVAQARLYEHLCNVQHDGAPLKLALSEKDLPENSTRRYTSHNSPEVAVLMEDEAGDRDIVIRMQGGGVMRMKDTHRAADPLFFVLMHPHGNPGWRLGMTRKTRTGEPKNLSPSKFYKYHLFQRKSENGQIKGCAHMRCGRLFQEWCCLMFAKAENQWLNFQRFNQKQLRADLYQNVIDSVGAGNPRAGVRVILAPSFIGSPRYMHKRFQDAMAVVRRHGKPDFFITMTCNPKWDEISHALFPGQTWRDRPDVVARVFRLKMRQLLKELKEDGIFGKEVAYFMVIEFQKRGLPHAHILLIVDSEDKLCTTEDIDSCICAELPPDPELCTMALGFTKDQERQAKELNDIVLTNMVHGPCGVNVNPGSPCMYNKQGEQCDCCQKNYPMDFCQETE